MEGWMGNGGDPGRGVLTSAEPLVWGSSTHHQITRYYPSGSQNRKSFYGQSAIIDKQLSTFCGNETRILHPKYINLNRINFIAQMKRQQMKRQQMKRQRMKRQRMKRQWMKRQRVKRQRMKRQRMNRQRMKRQRMKRQRMKTATYCH